MSSKSKFAQTVAGLYDVAQIQRAMQADARASKPPEGENTFVAPRTPIEEQLALIWSEFLGVDRVGIHDDFFALGGDSIVGVQVLSRVSERFRVQISARALLSESFTVAKLARTVALQWVLRANVAQVAAKLAELDGLSDEKVQTLLVQYRTG
jgi:acyl carrier protein